MNEETKQFKEIFEKHNDPTEVTRRELEKIKEKIGEDKNFNNYAGN